MPNTELVTPNEPYEERIKEFSGGSDPAGHPARPDRTTAPPVQGHRLGPAAGVEMEGTQNVLNVTDEPPRPPAQGDHLPEPHEGGPTHPNTYHLEGTRMTGGFVRNPGEPQPDELRITADVPLPSAESESEQGGGMVGAGQGSGTSPMPKNHSTRHDPDAMAREDPGTGDPSLGSAT